MSFSIDTFQIPNNSYESIYLLKEYYIYLQDWALYKTSAMKAARSGSGTNEKRKLFIIIFYSQFTVIIEHQSQNAPSVHHCVVYCLCTFVYICVFYKCTLTLNKMCSMLWRWMSLENILRWRHWLNGYNITVFIWKCEIVLFY